MLNRVWRKSRLVRTRRSFRRTLTFYIALAAVLPVLVLGALSYYNVKNGLEKEMDIWSRYVLNNSKEAFEMIMNQIFYQASYLPTSSTTKDYENVFNAISYENKSVHTFAHDLNGLNEYLYFKKNMIKMMSALHMNNRYIDEIYYYDEEKAMVLTSDGLQYEMDKFHDVAWLDTVREGSDMFVRMNVRKLNGNGIEKNVVTLLYRTFNKNNAFIVNVNMNELYAGTIEKMSAGRDDYYLYTGDGDMFISSEGSSIDRLKTIPMDLMEGEESGSVLYDKHYLLTWVHSDKLGWTFINHKNLQSYYGNMKRTTNMILLACVLMLLVIAGLSPYVSSRLYSPVLRLMQMIKQKTDASETLKEFDDFGYLEGRFESIYNEKFDLQKKFTEHLPMLQTMFKYELIKYGSFSRKELLAKQEELALHIPQGNLVLAAIHIESSDRERSEHFRGKQVQSLYVQQWMKETLSDYLGFSAEINDCLCLVVHIAEDKRDSLYRKLQQAREEIGRSSNLDLTIGIGAYCKDIMELNRAYHEAEEALKRRLAYGNKQIILYEELCTAGGNSYHYPVEKEKALNHLIASGNGEAALALLATIVEELTNPRHELSHSKLQHAVQMLLSSILRTAETLELDTDALLEADADLYDKLLHKTNRDDLLATLSALVEKIILCYAEGADENVNKDVQKIVAFIDEHYNRDLSLVDVADYAGFNPSHVSRLLKNGIGRSYTDYVTEKRIAHAERLLVSTSKKLDVISAEVGYNNTYYFIKVFRKHYGTTPSKYRQAQKESRNKEMDKKKGGQG
ncbi:helix-turn-helix domain-containing protein [Paenibacillus chungangensis]|uniref:Helix-turn-helix domain-containing protein n=1 Tax=Paenibacillus chungangensis TaxID=696535 RepID=A0ABW3HT08_9BACL